MAGEIGRVGQAVIGEMHEQAGEEDAVGAGFQRQDEIGILGGRGDARVDDHDFRAALSAVLLDAPEQHGMAPGRVGADQYDQVGTVEILVTARYGVGA